MICSGTNTDDLGDFRPGLGAAKERLVRHPFVEAGVDKAAVRALARHHGLTDLAELPAQPCLASRVETGLPIIADQLDLIDRVERQTANALGAGDIRCRVTASAFGWNCHRITWRQCQTMFAKRSVRRFSKPGTALPVSDPTNAAVRF